MTEYITKERAQDLIVTATQGNGSRLACLLSKLEDEPAADVAPVVHGKWLDGRTILENAVCSNCKTTYEAYYSKYQYCPRCGARMDGGESDD